MIRFTGGGIHVHAVHLSGCLSTPSIAQRLNPDDISHSLSFCGMRLTSTYALDWVSPVPLTVYLVVGDGDAGAQHCGSIATGQHPDRTVGGIIGEDVGELHGVDGHVHAAHHLHSAKHRALHKWGVERMGKGKWLR